NRNNSEQGKSALDAVGYSTQRREDGLPGSQGTIGFGDADGPNPAHGAPSSHDPGQTLTSSGSFGPDGESTGGRRPLSAEDKAAFWDNWKGETRAQTDASIAELRRMGYDTAEIEGKVQAYRNNQDSIPANSNSTQNTTHQSQGTGLYGGVVQNILNSAITGASNLWDRVTGGSKPIAHQTAPVFELDNGAKLPFENQGSGYGRVRILHDSKTGESKTTGPHTGLDQPQASGTPVPVVDDGKVILVNRDFRTRTEGGKGYGAVVVVQHNNGILTLYGHNSKINVNEGDTVTRGQIISNVGNSGNSWGAHMHYEVRTGNNITKGNFYGKTEHHDPSTFDWNQ
ncbi:M23 family metallopeptidase, partial [Leptospira borgpetersenii]